MPTTRRWPITLKLPPAPGAIQHEITRAELAWLDFMYPGAEQMEYLRTRFGFHPLHLSDVPTQLQRPKLDENHDPGYIFLVIHVPVYDEMPRLPIISEVKIFAGQDYIITCHNGRIRPLVHLVQDAAKEQVQQRIMERGSGYLLYSILNVLIDTSAPQVHQLYQKLDQIDSDMFRRDVQGTVEELSFLRRDMISLRRIMRPNLPVFTVLANRQHTFLGLDENAYFGDLADKLSKLWDMLEEQKEIIEGLDATLSSLTSHRINQEMRTFTVISLIFLPMTLVASILGMNVVIPGANHPASLAIALLLISLFGVVMFIYFRSKHLV